MNDYELKQEARRERYERKAEQLRTEAGRLHNQAHDMASIIPLGQPILVGHHSEHRDRRYRERIHDTFSKAFSTMDKADYYEQKAASVGAGGISSDDPDAIRKLREKLDSLKKNQERMKSANAAIRRHKVPERQIPALIALGMTEEQAVELLKPDCFGCAGFPSYTLKNNNANIRRVELRIRQLEAAKRNGFVEYPGNGYIFREDPEENRIMFKFDDKPAEAVRTLLKSYGFKWSPTRGAWVRMLNGMGRYAAERVREELEKND